MEQPERGLVVRYAYLWHAEARRGQEEGSKDRPCVIVLAVHRLEGERPRVMVAPITHSPPTQPGDAIELPTRVSAALGLDDQRSWVVATEVNVFTWPGPDLRPARGRSTTFGRLPFALLEQIRRAILERDRTRLRAVERDERS